MVLDLKHPDGLAVLLRIVESADVFVHSFRPTVPLRLGIDYDRLKSINSRLIYCALSGFGETGPLKDKAGYDQVLQSMTGVCSFQGEKTGVPEIVYGSIVDFYAASLLAFGVSSALFHRERTGEGQYLGVSLLRTALAMQSGRLIWANTEGRDVKRDMRSGGITGIHPTKSGYIYISANTPHFWAALCELIGLAELATDPKYGTIRKRAARAGELVPKLREALQQHTAIEWERLFGERVPCSAVRTIEDMFDHPQVIAEEMVACYEHPVVGKYRGFARPVKFSATPSPTTSAAPVFAQHTETILGRFGYSPDEVQAMREKGAVVLQAPEDLRPQNCFDQ